MNAVYRGFAKTSIAERAALWAVLYGHRRFVVVFGANEPAAGGIIDAIKSELEDNDLLFGDFPRVCDPIRKLEGRVQRALSQHQGGVRTHVTWRADLLALPWIKRSEAAGAVVCARGISGGFRGLKHHRPDGVEQRPDLLLLDDAQTDEMAASELQVGKTLSLLRKAVVKLGGHRKALAIVCNATVIQEGDVVDALLADTAWEGERIPLVRAWPDAHKTLWLDDYARLRRTFNKDVVGDQARAHKAATAFYAARREEMDWGAEVSWENCFDPDTELSALQHAYNALLDDGEEAFASEYQQRPHPRVPDRPNDLKPDAVAARVNNCPPGLVPPGCNRLTAFVDVQKDLLYYAVCAWSEGFGGAVIDYGAWPDQRRAYWALADANPTLAGATGVSSLHGSLYAGLTALSAQLLGREWGLHGTPGGALRVERCLVDSGWEEELVRRFCRQDAHAAVLLPSKGLGISAAMVPMSDWPPKPGERRGRGWVLRPPQAGRGRLLLYDANAAKSFLAGRLSAPLGEAGALTLWGDDPGRHRMLADHCCAEHAIATEGRGRKLEEWRLRPGRTENHLWDCLNGCTVAAASLGLEPAGMPKPAPKKRERVSYKQLQDRAREGRR